MTFTIRRSFLVVLVCLVVVVAGVFVSQRASAASSTPVVYVATGENFPDALGAASAAAVQGGPILLVRQNSIPNATKGELSRLNPDVIYIAGGSDVVSDGVLNQLKAYAGSVIRVQGDTRYETAVEVSKSAFPATIDADTLQGKGASAFLPASGKAVDAQLLDGIDSDSFLPGGTPPVGTTARGNYALGNDSSWAWDSFTWGFEMPARPVGHVLRVGAPSTAACPGTVENPLAAPGHLCVYEFKSSNSLSLSVFGAGDPSGIGSDTFGASIFSTASGAGNQYSYGSWAVTVGVAVTSASVSEVQPIP